MKTIYCFVMLSLATTACQKTKPAADTPTASTTALEDSAAILKKRPTADTPRSAADRLIRALYFEHNTKENPFREVHDRSLIDQFFAKSTADLIWKDTVKSSRKINRTKTNLLFNAPDASIKKTWVLPALVGGSRAFVYVTFQENGKPEELKIDLQQLTGRWRIKDIYYPDGKQLTHLLE